MKRKVVEHRNRYDDELAPSHWETPSLRLKAPGEGEGGLGKRTRKGSLGNQGAKGAGKEKVRVRERKRGVEDRERKEGKRREEGDNDR